MSRIAYVNGAYRRHAEASVHIEDRGYQFADGVYEVIAVAGGRLIDPVLHHERLERSLAAIGIAQPMGRAALGQVLDETIRRNGVNDGIVYFQVTRGVSRRDHPFPKTPIRPALVVTSRSGLGPGAKAMEEGVGVITRPDIRWGRCDIKSVALLANVLVKQDARAAGCHEVWQVDRDGFVTEGGSSNSWMVDRDGALITRPADHSILNGITRIALIELAKKAGFKVIERKFTAEEAKSAREAFITSTTSFVLPVVRIDDSPVGNGYPGETARRLQALYAAHVAAAGRA
ncbi:MAG: D-amino-acid transaminase [Alphaproteobacteria bacterium]|nr:D-amino-acid transaminase [Alphaproteobacteria bacterium]